MAGGDEELRAVAARLEELLATAPDSQHRTIAAAVAAEVALERGLDSLEEAASDARLYLDSFPPEGRPLGDVELRAARWLAVRYGTTERRAAARSALDALADRADAEAPRAAAALAALRAEPLPDDASADDLWLHVAAAIVARVPG